MKLQNLFFLLALLFVSFEAHAGGFIVVNPEQAGLGNRRAFPLEHRSLKVETTILGQMAQTSIDQVFYNPGNQQLEGYFLFPVPKDVSIADFSMFINGKETKAELLDAKKARKIYEDIVRQSLDPALLEFFEQDLFRVRIFPILPKAEQRIKLSYRETLEKDNGMSLYRFPLNTQKHAAKPLENFSLRINMEHEENYKSIYCPSHELEILRKGEKRALASMEAKNLVGDRDFELYFSTANKNLGLSLLSHRIEGEEAGYFMLSLSPGLNRKAEVIEKDVVFVFDKSGSMSDAKMEQAKKALNFCIAQLNPKDRFELVVFSTEAESLFGKLQGAEQGQKKQAQKFLKDLSAIGGTNLDEALDMAFAVQDKSSKRPFMLILISDGKPTIGETKEDALLAKLAKTNKEQVRIFSFGIGHDLNTRLIDRLTNETKGYRVYAHEEEDIELKVSNFYQNFSSPILSDLVLEFDKDVRISGIYPKQLPDLFLGSDLNIMGRFVGEGETSLRIRGKINGREELIEYKFNLAKEAKNKYEFIPHLWATRAVGYLLEQVREQGESEELRKEIVRLAKKHGIITPYTSLLILEDEALAVRPPRPGPRPVPRPRHEPLLSQRSAPSSDLNVRLEEESKAQRRSKENSSGQAAVRASSSNQSMEGARIVGEQVQGREQLAYTDDAGKERNLADGIRQVQGRAFYRNNAQWMDANLGIRDLDKKNERRIAFGSKDYFKLLEEPELLPILALGNNLRFVHRNEIIEIYL